MVKYGKTTARRCFWTPTRCVAWPPWDIHRNLLYHYKNPTPRASFLIPWALAGGKARGIVSAATQVVPGGCRDLPRYQHWTLSPVNHWHSRTRKQQNIQESAFFINTSIETSLSALAAILNCGTKYGRCNVQKDGAPILVEVFKTIPSRMGQ